MSLKAIIIDSNKKALTALRSLILNHCHCLKIIGEAQNTSEAIELLKITKPEIVFLDIELKGGSGFKVLEEIQPYCFQVVFVTALEEITINALRINATDYLLKPVAIPELIEAVERVVTNYKSKNSTYINSVTVQKKQIKELILPYKNAYKTIPVKNILLLEANGSYTNIILENKDTIMCSKNLGYFQDLLDGEGFHRVHRKHLVPLNQVKEMITESSNFVIVLKTGLQIDVSFRARKSLIQRIENLQVYDL